MKKSWVTITLFGFIIALFTSCLSSQSEKEESDEKKKETTGDLGYVGDSLTAETVIYKKVPVFYATDRKRNEKNYGDLRNEEDRYKVGIVLVSIPIRKHKEGEIEEPSGWEKWAASFYRKNLYRANYFDIIKTEEMNEGSYFDQIRKVVANSTEKDLFVFIHGYNNSFEDAAKRTAQITYDLEFKGAPVMYSWPSIDKALGYVADGDNESWALPHLINFLQKISDSAKADKIHIIAHSMGNRLLTEALKSFNQEKKFKVFDQIILAAPDIDAAIFKTQIADKILDPCKRITMYSSSNDKALLESKKLHGGYLRVGETGQNICIYNGITTVDASNLKVSDFFDHAYFAQAQPVLNDIKDLFRFNADPQSRNLIQISNNKGPYWTFR